MNKRIRELYDQCIVGRNNDAQWIESELDSEKFAELIVRECMDYASRNWEHGHLLAQDLKTHFGVEE